MNTLDYKYNLYNEGVKLESRGIVVDVLDDKVLVKLLTRLFTSAALSGILEASCAVKNDIWN